MDEFVKLQNITKIYKMGEVEIRAADGISFYVRKGEFVVIVGPSGAGKTTVLNILGGMDTATEGTLLVDGQDITRYILAEQLTGVPPGGHRICLPVLQSGAESDRSGKCGACPPDLPGSAGRPQGAGRSGTGRPAE